MLPRSWLSILIAFLLAGGYALCYPPRPDLHLGQIVEPVPGASYAKVLRVYDVADLLDAQMDLTRSLDPAGTSRGEAGKNIERLAWETIGRYGKTESRLVQVVDGHLTVVAYEPQQEKLARVLGMIRRAR